MRLTVWILLLASPAVFAAPTNYFELDAARFQAAASQVMAARTLNHALLEAAILRETNERREKGGLPALKPNVKATEAAKIQSDIMSKRGSIGHANPENAPYRTLELRVKSVGLEYRLIAENVASTFGIQYQSGRTYFRDRQNGRTNFRYSLRGPAIPPHTYATFAKALVDAWMNSKGHRENIMRKEAQYLGSHCTPARATEMEMPMYYCTQVFFTPRK